MAQDVHFSQYYLTPLTLNPANTGNYQGDYRFFGNYRNQWRDISQQPYATFSAGGDFNTFPNNLNFSGGLIFLNDKSGSNLNVNKIFASVAHHRKISGFNFHLGVQPGVVNKSNDINSHTFPNQFDWGTGGFNKNINNYENIAGQSFTYFDLNAGIVVSRRFGNIEPELGVAYFHLNKPKENFLGGKDSHLSMRHTYTGALSYYVNTTFILKLHSLYGYTDQVSDWVSGLNIEYLLSKIGAFQNSLFVGFMWRDGFNRNPDAGIVTAGLNYSHYTIGCSYDVTFSKLKTSVNSRGAFEIALIYRAKTTRLTTKILPCERY